VFLTAHDSTERQNACLREIHDVYSLFIDAKDLCVSYLLKDNIYIYIYLLIYICQYLVFKNWQMTRKSEIPSFAKCDRGGGRTTPKVAAAKEKAVDNWTGIWYGHCKA
jgi:hypothetical protein